MSYKEDEALLEENGWEVECQSPFEIRHQVSNCVATGEAAYIILRSLKPIDRSPRSLIYDLEPDDDRYLDKLDILHKLVHNPHCGHIIPKEIANWCKSVGLCAELSTEDGGAWWTCRVKDKEDNEMDEDTSYKYSEALSEHLYKWLSVQKYGEEALLHAAVCCDFVGATRFKNALAIEIFTFLNKNNGTQRFK
jgi:hypothetical protein